MDGRFGGFLQSRFYVLAVALLLFTPFATFAKKHYLTITTQPAGATVEINGIEVGKTPYQVEIPETYVKGSHWVTAKFMRGQMHLKLTLDGYLPKELDLANGPMRLTNLNGVYFGDYWLLKTDTFNFVLTKAATTFAGTGPVLSTTSQAEAPVSPHIELATEDIVSRANPAVLYLQGSDGSGSGFLITGAGVAVTNAHVARGQDELIATTANGQSFQAKVVYIDDSLDIALLKLQGDGFSYLILAPTSTVRPGSTVIAIGTPSKGFQNSVTKGIVGGIGTMAAEPGTWLQTDAAINPGNSGGPLLNSLGEVVGITTQKRFVSTDGRPLQGIGFALSSDDLLTILRRFYPDRTNTEVAARTTTGKVSIEADTKAADIYVDGEFVGNTPGVFTLPSGNHDIEVKTTDGKDWQRKLDLLSDSDVRLSAVLQEPHDQMPQNGTTSLVSILGGADVFVDNVFTGHTPITLTAKAGQHSVRIVLNGYKEWSQEVTVVSGAESRLTISLQKAE